MLLLLWAPIAVPVHLLVRDRNLVNLLTLPVLYAEFWLLLRFWGQTVYKQSDLLWRYGLEFSKQSGRELLAGGTIAAVSLTLVLGVEVLLGWLVWKPPTIGILRVLLEAPLIAIAFSFAEELLFRGWLLDELQRDYYPKLAMWIDAIAFALLHFIRPVEDLVRLAPQFPALVLLGLALVWAKRSRVDVRNSVLRERLALPIGLHAGLVGTYYIFEVGSLVQPSHRVPDWITGIGGNPLAGAIGIVFLGVLVLGLRRTALHKSIANL